MRAAALRRLVPVLGANAVPIAGVFAAGWSGPTALTLYWCENLLAALLVGLRLLLHRRWTRKRGYGRLQLGFETHRHDERRRPPRRLMLPERRDGSFVAEFGAAAGAATVVHGVLLWWMLRGVFAELPQDAALRLGLIGIAAFQLLGFAFDLVGLRDRPFAWARELAQNAVNRVLLVHLALIAGFWAFTRSGTSGFFGPFAVLKGAADVGNLLAHAGFHADPEEAPPWLAATMNRLRHDADFATDWRERKAAERRLAAEDEETVTARTLPSRVAAKSRRRRR